MKGKKMNNRTLWELYDDVTNYGITIINDELYLVKDGKTMKLSSLSLIDRREEN